MEQRGVVSNDEAQFGQFSYSFSVWPDEKWGFQREVYELFRMLNGRVDMIFTQDEFERFRSALSHDGFTIREVERIPYCEPEAVP
jgi:hypothetical protein